ncbi:hypothetical protein SUGI_0885880 [Cryptomeria japonica]|nr:hypothetical protein SUGI_0885880 [Cryptomeria japonica]
MIEVIQEEVSREDNEMLMCPFSLQEVKKSTFSLHPNKAPGPDDFTIEVFQKCWDFMGEDIWKVVEDFKKKRRFVREINNTIIVLIPKKLNYETMADFHLISLCNSLFKIISKAFDIQLKTILNKLSRRSSKVSPQGGKS